MSASESLDARFLRALSHPLRLHIMDLLTDQGALSPVQVARQTGRPLTTVSHHMRMLRDLGFVALVGTAQRRGAVEHFYKARWDAIMSDAQWEQLPVALRRSITGQTLARIGIEASRAAATGGFDAPGAHVDRVPLRLDAEGRVELSQALSALVVEAQAISRRSADREGSGESDDRAPSVLAILHFSVDRDDADVGAVSG